MVLTPYDITPAFRLTAKIEALYKTPDQEFVTEAVDALDLTFGGIEGDRHGGITRKSGGREPWYKRGTEMRNERHLTVLAFDELQEVADAMGIPEIKPEWIGGNMVLSGIPNLSSLPASTLIYFEGGVTLKVDYMNGPCSISGASIAKFAGIEDVVKAKLDFPKIAKRKRGTLVWVEKPGRIEVGETARVQIPDQWMYSAQ